jgi:Glycosyltransferase family 28 N-terminal domain
MNIGITGKPDAKIVFKNAITRDQAIKHVDSVLSSRSFSPSRPGSPTPSVTPMPSRTPVPTYTSTLSESPPPSPRQFPTDRAIPDTRKRDAVSILAPLSRSIAAAVAASADLPHSARTKLPKVINLPHDTLLTREALHFVCLTIGSRGDVQPYIALGLGLKKEGHTVTIVTHEEYKDWIVGFGLSHRTAGGDPGALMKLSVENKVRAYLLKIVLMNSDFSARCSRQNSLDKASQTYAHLKILYPSTRSIDFLNVLSSDRGLTNVRIYLSLDSRINRFCSACGILGSVSRCRSPFGKPIGNGWSSYCRGT